MKFETLDHGQDMEGGEERQTKKSNLGRVAVNLYGEQRRGERCSKQRKPRSEKAHIPGMLAKVKA